MKYDNIVSSINVLYLTYIQIPKLFRKKYVDN